MLSSWHHSKENPIEFNYSLDGKFIARASSAMYFRLSWQLGVCFPVPRQFTFYISLAYPQGMMFLLRLPENVGRELTSLFLAKEASFPRISCPVSCCKKSVRRTVMASSIKLLLAIRILRYSLAVNLLILPNDVSLNPGPTGPSLHSSFSSSSSFDSSIALENCNDISSHFDLGSDDKGLRIGHWNVNRLSSEKFDQIKLFLIGKSGRAQVDMRVAWVNQAPWITPAIIKQLQFRDALLKKFRRHRNPSVWADYKKARNKAVSMLRNIKRKFYVSKLEQNENDAKGTWKIIKSISGMVKQSKRVNSL